MNKINLNSVAFLVLGVFLLLTPALSQAIITSLVTAFFRDIDLLLWVNLAQNFWILNLIPKVVGATLVAGFAWKHLKTRFKVDLPKIKVQTTRLATYSLLFMLCAGLFLFADVPVSEAATTATTGYILDTPVSEYAWLIGAYSDGTYYAINGGTWDNMVAGVGSTAWATYKTNSTALTAQVLAACTSGTIYMKDVAFDMDLFDDIPEDVRVICSYNAEYWEYINSADSSGSPYTISVGSGVNVGYYLAADSEGRICFTSTNISSIFNSVAQNNTVIYLNPLSAELLNSITISHKANITIEADRASLLWSTMDDAFIEITQSSNINIRGLWLKGDADGAKHEQRGIQMFDHCSNILIENNQVENMGYDGILALYTVNNLKILNNDVIGCQDDGINPGGGGGNEEGIGQTVVSGNYIANSGSDGLHLSDRSRQTIATNNFIVNCNYGISIYNSSYNIISNNIITGCRYGIGTVFGLCPGLTISDNLINETTVGAGISLNGHGAHFSSVTGNKILYPAAYGIDIGASNNINIDDNTIKGGTRAIYISAYLVTVTNNNIWAPTNYGIVVSGVGTGNCTVIGNLIEYGCASGAIYISSSFNTVSQNILRTVGAGIIEPTTYGADYNIFSQCSSDKPIMLTGEHTSISQSWNGTTLINYMVGGVEKLP